MSNTLTKAVVCLLVVVLMPMSGAAKKGKSKKSKPAYVFTIDKEVARTSVKDQARTGTCWIFSAVSFLESELLRMGKGEIDLSEMFVVRHTYPQKAIRYIRRHGGANFGAGGQFHDVIDQVRSCGIVPEEVYPGQNIAERLHNHGEMDAVLKGVLDAVLQRRGRRVTPRWLEAFNAVLDVYLGKPPETFAFKGKSYTPKRFVSDHLGLNMDDYIEVTSYNHHPFYRQIMLEIPDNWTYNRDYYNVPIDDLEQIVDDALEKGYSVAWDADVSERDFSPRGKESLEVYDAAEYAIVPLKDREDLTEAERQEKYTKPVQEKEITQEMRQQTFDNFTTTDDHLMHIVGLAHDQVGTKFYLVKNSWGTDRRFKGYQYVSRSYFRLKTICLMINKHSLTPQLKAKLGIQ